jgi:hypothetical protein
MRGAVKLSHGPGKRKSASGRMILQGKRIASRKRDRAEKTTQRKTSIS